MPNLNTRDIDAVTGATYFVVGRGTEGGPSSYHMTIAGITVGKSDPHWGEVSRVADNSGYSLGTIQVDLGQRGTWALGATDGAKLQPGQTTYVDGIIGEAAKYAKEHNLKFPQDTKQLRADLLSHGDGEKGHGTLRFIDKDTRDSLNAWASSEDGQKWIHKNIDYPQVKAATQTAVDMLDKYGKNIPEDRRLETIAILAKTENQMPGKMKGYEEILKKGGNYDDVLAHAKDIKRHTNYYDGPKAAAIAEEYKNAYKDPDKAAAIDRAQAKVGAKDFNPAKSADDADIKEALKAVGQGGRAHGAHGSLHQGAHGEAVSKMQGDLAALGYTDAKKQAIKPDGDFGPGTKAALEKFQSEHGLKPDGVAGPKTLEALNKAAHPPLPGLADSRNPGNAMYNQALANVRGIDAAHGRSSDQQSNNFAGALTASAKAAGLERIDHVVMSDDGKRAYAVQGDLNSPFKRMAEVDVAKAVATPLQQSSAEFQKHSQPQPGQQPDQAQHQRQQPQAPQQPEPQGMQR